jgi:hypothetical protein
VRSTVIHVARPMAALDQVPFAARPYTFRRRNHLRMRHRPQTAEIPATQA